MCEQKSISKGEYFRLIDSTKKGHVPKSTRRQVEEHVLFSGEHHPANKEEDWALRRSHFAAILKRELSPEQLNVGVAIRRREE